MEREVISDTFSLKAKIMPPDIEFIEQAIKDRGVEVLRWAIVDIKENNLTISYSGIKS